MLWFKSVINQWFGRWNVAVTADGHILVDQIEGTSVIVNVPDGDPFDFTERRRRVGQDACWAE
jgi:hypothetical protein